MNQTAAGAVVAGGGGGMRDNDQFQCWLMLRGVVVYDNVTMVPTALCAPRDTS